jgi:hypothetical protein
LFKNNNFVFNGEQSDVLAQWLHLGIPDSGSSKHDIKEDPMGLNTIKQSQVGDEQNTVSSNHKEGSDPSQGLGNATSPKRWITQDVVK